MFELHLNCKNSESSNFYMLGKKKGCRAWDLILENMILGFFKENLFEIGGKVTKSFTWVGNLELN